MNKDLTIIILGILVALLPFLGFPRSLETAIFVASGLSIAVFALLLRRKLTAYSSMLFRSEKRTDAYVENSISNVDENK
jgi:hypothetical protein